MSNNTFIVGAYEHPTRLATNKSVTQLHAEVAIGALDDAGLSKGDIDGFFCAGDAPGIGPLSILEYLGLDVSYADSTDIGGSSPIAQVGHAMRAIRDGKCNVALITSAGRPRSEAAAAGDLALHDRGAAARLARTVHRQCRRCVAGGLDSVPGVGVGADRPDDAGRCRAGPLRRSLAWPPCSRAADAAIRVHGALRHADRRRGASPPRRHAGPRLPATVEPPYLAQLWQSDRDAAGAGPRPGAPRGGSDALPRLCRPFFPHRPGAAAVARLDRRLDYRSGRLRRARG